LICGCARIPKKDLQARLSPAISVEHTKDAALKEGDFEPGPWPDDHWWFMFDDPQLSLLIERVLNNNPDMGIASMRARKALQEAYVVRSALFPHLKGGFEFNWEHLSKDNLYRFPPSMIPANIHQFILGLELTYEFDIWGKNRQRYKAALGEARVAAAEAAVTTLNLSTAAAKGYFNLQTAIEKEKMLQERSKAENELLFLIEQRFAHGLANQLDVKEQANRVYKTDQELVANTERISLGKNFLRALMGDSPDSDEEMLTPQARYTGKFPLPERLSLDLIARRPDVTARVWQVEKAAHLIGAAKALFYPDLNLLAAGGFSSLSWNMFFNKSSLAGQLNPAIHLPIFLGGKLRANLDARVAEFEEMVYEYNHTLLVAAEEVADSITNVQSASQRLKDQVQVVDEIAGIYDLSFANYKSGLDSRIQLLEREVAYLDAQMKQYEIEGERLIQITGLIKALGGGYEDHCNKQAEWEEDARSACGK
ncbi:MAG: efflux transporter outer membrane subunit, partial [Chlamydiia bacterium]|nr:efflux transporter outer membrane subunit [Chlamydiia bacterium]